MSLFVSVRLFAHNTSTAERIFVNFGTVAFLDTFQFWLNDILHEDLLAFLLAACSVFTTAKNTFNQYTGEN
jgi:hypothetical protein